MLADFSIPAQIFDAYELSCVEWSEYAEYSFPSAFMCILPHWGFCVYLSFQIPPSMVYYYRRDILPEW